MGHIAKEKKNLLNNTVQTRESLWGDGGVEGVPSQVIEILK